MMIILFSLNAPNLEIMEKSQYVSIIIINKIVFQNILAVILDISNIF